VNGIKKAIVGMVAALTIFSAGCSRSGSIDAQVREFLKQSDVGGAYSSLRIDEVKNLSRDYVKVYAHFSTDRFGHPLISRESAKNGQKEVHSLEMIIDEKPLDGSQYKVVYARDSHSWMRNNNGMELAPEQAWNYITQKHFSPGEDFDPSTPERDILWNGTRYYPVVYVKFPEISDYEKGSIAIIGERDGYDIWGWYGSTNANVQRTPSSKVLIIPEGTGFYIWSSRD